MDSANRLTAVGGTPVTTDADGNLLVDANGNQYRWDARGRLVSITKNGTTVASYTYATNGIRTAATEGGVTTNFTLDGTRCVNEAVGSSNTASMFGPTGVLCRGTQWFTPTANGSIGSVTDGSGNAVAQNRYGVFGQMVTTNPNAGDPLQFLGGMSDASTGLDYLGSGFYEPSLGMSVGGGGGGLATVASFAPGGGGAPQISTQGTGGDWLNHASSLFGCWGDALTGGATRFIRGILGVDNQVDYNSGWCHAGTSIGIVHSILLTEPEAPGGGINEPPGPTEPPTLGPTEPPGGGGGSGGGGPDDPSAGFPPNDGFLEPTANINLTPGQTLWRYGSSAGSFVTDPGTPPEALSLPTQNPGSSGAPPSVWTVTGTIYDVTSGTVAPWYGEPGFGHGYVLPDSIDSLVEAGLLAPG